MEKPCIQSNQLIRFKKTREVLSPKYSTDGSAGIDFFVPSDIMTSTVVSPRGSIIIPTGIHVKLPEGTALVGFNKSGIATKHSLILGACVIDSDYQGEVHIHLINVGYKPVVIEANAKLAQFILLSTPTAKLEEETGELYEVISQRASGGFGSTGNE